MLIFSTLQMNREYLIMTNRLNSLVSLISWILGREEKKGSGNSCLYSIESMCFKLINCLLLHKSKGRIGITQTTQSCAFAIQPSSSSCVRRCLRRSRWSSLSSFTQKIWSFKVTWSWRYSSSCSSSFESLSADSHPSSPSLQTLSFPPPRKNISRKASLLKPINLMTLHIRKLSTLLSLNSSNSSFPSYSLTSTCFNKAKVLKKIKNVLSITLSWLKMQWDW